MRFVPFGDIYISAWQTRVRDFEAFVQATGYDAVGGMVSAVTQNGFRLNTMSWKAPGFVQTPEHPVVGVSWEDANQFCAWLTKRNGLKERSQRFKATGYQPIVSGAGLPGSSANKALRRRIAAER